MEKTYFDRLDDARQYAKKKMTDEHPWFLKIRGYINAYFTQTTDSLQGITVAETNLQYQLLLLISFMRTHYVVYELIFLCSNVEAATLARKQIELLSRIKELKHRNADELKKKVPNVRCLEYFKIEYGLLSEIAHSSSCDSLDFLGYNMDDDIHKRFYAQPTYTADTEELMFLWSELFIEFILSSISIKETVVPQYNIMWDMEFLCRFLSFGKENNVRYARSIDVEQFRSMIRQ